MSNIKPIETRYKGYRFRSRLEARWAVFFDALGVNWTYEIENGYDLGDAGYYLPDFWVPYPFMHGAGEWIEIKPEPPTEDEKRKLAALAEYTGHRAYCLSGNPWPDEHNVSIWQHHRNERPPKIPLYENAHIVEEFDGIGETRIYFDVGETNGVMFTFPSGRMDDLNLQPGDLERAFRHARSARFEHGETPQ